LDRQILNIERAYALQPENAQIRHRLLNEMTRCGRYYDARKLVQRQMATSEFCETDLKNLAELGRLSGFITSYPVRRSSLMNFSAIFHSRPNVATDVEVEIGFVGIDGSGALMSVLALANFFGCPISGLAGSGLHSSELSNQPQDRFNYPSANPTTVLEIQKPGETVYEFRLELSKPWIISRRFRLSAIRVTTLPTAISKVTLRRKVLRTVNALAFVADTRSDGTGQTNENVFRRVSHEFEKLWGLPLEEFRIALQYLEPTRQELHRALLASLGMGRSPRIHANIETNAKPANRPHPLFSNFRVGRNQILAHEGVLDTFALLLLRAIGDLSRV
jgi:hypothetical protein